ncbi:hypothetical protein ACVWWP_007104 [Bradyrhizobium sp. LM3.6]
MLRLVLRRAGAICTGDLKLALVCRKLNIVVMSGSLTGPLPAHTTFLHKRFSPVSFLQAVRKLRLATVLSTGQRVYQCVECDRVEVD